MDRRITASFGLTEAEEVLIEDLYNFTLGDFKGWEDSPGRRRTDEGADGRSGEELLGEYCRFIMRVLKAGFGVDRPVSTTVFSLPSDDSLPIRLVALHLGSASKPDVRVEKIDSPRLLDSLHQLDEKMLRTIGRGGAMYERSARIYDVMNIDGLTIPTVYIVKPDQIRYWTRSIAMRDADQIASDLVSWSESNIT